MANSSTAPAPKSIDITSETLANLPWPDREHFDASLAEIGLKLASRITSDAFWFDIGDGFWLWVETTRLGREDLNGRTATSC